MKTHRFIIFIWLAILGGIFVYAQPGTEDNRLGNEAYQNKDYKKAVRKWKKSAEKGNIEGMYNLGVAYSEGTAVGKDSEEALKWYKKSSDGGHINASYNLGYIYQEQKDGETALKYYKRAADKGDGNSMTKIGDMYYFGDGLKKNLIQAFDWYEKGAEAGDSEGMYKLGALYFSGEGVVKNYVESFYWIVTSADKGFEDAVKVLPQMKTLFTETADDDKFRKGYEAYEKNNFHEAFKWYKKAADEGNLNAIEFIGFMYGTGVGVSLNYEKSYKYFLVGAENDMSDSMYYIAQMIIDGNTADNDLGKAVLWAKKSAASGNGKAQEIVAQIDKWEEESGGVSNFLGVEAIEKGKYKEAFEYFQTSADKGNAMAMFNLGYCYEFGKGVQQERGRAIYWYAEAGDHGVAEAAYRVGLIYYLGLMGMVPNYSVSLEWFGKASDLGMPEAALAMEDAKEAIKAQQRFIEQEEARWEAYADRQERKYNGSDRETFKGYSYGPQTMQRYEITIRETEEKRRMDAWKLELDRKIYGVKY